MAQELAGKVAIVTGAGGRRGIGRGVAMELARHGAKVVVNDFGKAPDGAWAADVVVKEIAAEKGTAVPNHDSVTTMAGGESIVKTAIDNFGRADILVCCAGNYKPMQCLEFTEADWDSIIAVHIKGHFSVTRAVLPHMVKQKCGRIITFSSRGGTVAGGSWAYSTAKAGILGFTFQVAKDFKQHGITANVIIPAAVTGLFPHPTGFPPLGDNMPLAVSPEPEAIAPVVTWLATDNARDINGRVVYSSGSDIVLYNNPYKLTSANAFVRKVGGYWTVDEINEVIPSIAGVGR